MSFQWQIVTPQQIPALARKIQGWKAVVFDTESTGVEPFLGDKPLGIGLSPLEEEVYYYLPLEGLNLLDIAPLIEQLEQQPLIGHNIKFDLHMLETLGWSGQQELFYDTIVMARLWSKEERPALDLKYLAETILGYSYKYPDIVKAAKAGRLDKVDPEKAAYYCLEDVYNTKKLYQKFKSELPDHLLKLFMKECRLTRDLLDIESYGVLIDRDYLALAIERLNRELSLLLGLIRKVSDLPTFNPGSPLQTQQLMEQIGIKPVLRTPSGKPSWKREACLEVRNQHPVALMLAKHRALSYQRNGLIERAVEFMKVGKTLHGEFKNWGTVTGRLSSNMQQMPKGWLQFGTDKTAGDDVLKWAEDEQAKEQEFSLRRLIRPRAGYILIKADYKQIEMFVLGFYIKDPTFDRWLASGNVHAAVAQEVWGDGTLYYDRGKVYNFAKIYGQGVQARARSLNCSLEEAKQYGLDYDKRMPGYTRFLRRVEKLLSRDGHVRNVYGREYWFEEVRLAYRALNYLCQGSAGDFVKFRLPATRQLREQIGIKVGITTHDDFVAEIPEEEIKRLPEWINELRHSPFERELDLDVEYSLDSLVQLHPIGELINAA